jgi:hypothetical protein
VPGDADAEGHPAPHWLEFSPGADQALRELDIPRRWLRRNRRGLWYTPRDVPPGRIKRVIDFGELAGPSAAPGQ